MSKLPEHKPQHNFICQGAKSKNNDSMEKTQKLQRKGMVCQSSYSVED